MKYYVLNLRRMAFWKLNDRGYTTNLKEAKKFSFEEIYVRKDFPYPGNWNIIDSEIINTKEKLINLLKRKVRYLSVYSKDEQIINWIKQIINED